MGAPTTPYTILSKGYSISGDVRSGYRASVPFFMLWENAFTFADDIFGKTQAVKVGPITWKLPYRFPVTVAPLYAQRFNIEPMGLDKGGNPVTVANKGLRPGEYWTHAVVNVEFETPQALQQQEDDRNNLQQLDPDNPITACEQSVKFAGNMANHEGGSFVFFDGAKAQGTQGLPFSEARLVLSFPRIPYMPWGLIRPYINKINDVPILGCDRGSLLLLGMDTKITPGPDGYGQSIQLEFADNGVGLDWNMLPRKGVYELVRQTGQSWNDNNRIYKYIDMRAIFQQLTFDAE